MSFLEAAVQATPWQERIRTALPVSLLVAAFMWQVITRFINSMCREERRHLLPQHRQRLQQLRLLLPHLLQRQS